MKETENTGTAVRKRQQIESTNRTMFIWVAAAAALVGVAAVLCVSLSQRLMFNQEVISEKNQTVANLKHNNDIVEELRQNARVLNTDQSLLDTPRLEGSEPISVVLDALPSQANSSALGASLQKNLLRGVSIESLVVDPAAAEEGSSGSSDNGEITFTFSVSSKDPNRIRQVLRNLELSIRTINVQSLTIEKRTTSYTLSVKGVAYYSSEAKVELDTKKVKP